MNFVAPLLSLPGVRIKLTVQNLDGIFNDMEGNFLRIVSGLILVRIFLTIFLAISPSALATLYNIENKFSQKFYVFSRSSGHLIVEPLHYDFGTVEKGEWVSGQFKLYNSGNAILKFLKVAPGCGCTSAVVKKNVLLSGETTELEFKIDTHDKDAYFNSGIEVTTTDVNNPVMVLPITGWVGKGVKLNPASSYFGVLNAGQKLEGKLQVLYGGVGDLQILRVKMQNGLIKIGDITRKDEHTIEISASLQTDNVKEKRDYEDTIYVYTNSKEYPVLEATYRWTVSPNNISR